MMRDTQAQRCSLLDCLVTAVMADACDQAWPQRGKVPRRGGLPMTQPAIARMHAVSVFDKQMLYVLPTMHHRSRSWHQCQAHACGMHDSHASHNSLMSTEL